MKIVLEKLLIHTKKTVETIDLSKTITFIYGPVGKGKSTVARLIDYCLGGKLERTPAIQLEFVAAILYLRLGEYDCTIERSSEDNGSLRVTWSGPNDDIGSINAPIDPESVPIIEDKEVYSFSDLIYFFCGVNPIKVRKRSRDFDSPLIRLSFRDIWRYSYLDQEHLDNSFFRFEHPFKGRKSQDAMRFFTGLHSERLSQIEAELYEAQDEQRTKRGAVEQIRRFMEEFSLGSEIELKQQLSETDDKIKLKKEELQELKQQRLTEIHPTDELRNQIRGISEYANDLQISYNDSKDLLNEQQALYAELITAKIKADRAVQAGQLLKGVSIELCPECGANVSARSIETHQCRLCGSIEEQEIEQTAIEIELLRNELNSRIDELEEAIKRRNYSIEKTERELREILNKKRVMDLTLQEELSAYDSAIVEKMRKYDREIAMLEERLSFIDRLIQMPKAIDNLEEQAGAMQGKIDRLRSDLLRERKVLAEADVYISEIAKAFKEIMLNVGFPGVFSEDDVVIDPRNWKPIIQHDNIEWGFDETGSGGKKTLFNVCFALALHSVANNRNLPVPSVLIIDSPTKNISQDENPELVISLYRELYKLIADDKRLAQLILIDSDLIEPNYTDHTSFSKRHMAGTKEDPSLIPYYVGP